MIEKLYNQIGQNEEPPPIADFWASLTGFIRTYPWQTAMVLLATVAVLVNIKGTRSLVKALELKKK